MSNQPRFPIYIVSKGRSDTRLTMRCLDRIAVPYHVIIEQQEFSAYAQHIDASRLLVLDPAFQRDYDTCDELGDAKSKGPGPARNFAWAHAMAAGHPWHWVMDDNIVYFFRLNQNTKSLIDGTAFYCMEDFVLRYSNIGMAGPNYEMFVPRKVKTPPFVMNTRIYSCNLIRNDLPFRWRGRYNEDTDLSLRILKSGWCTVQFNAFIQKKTATQKMRGGNSDAFYDQEGTRPKSEMLVRMHGDVAKLVWKFHRWHHEVDYRPFKNNHLRRVAELPQGIDEFGMRLIDDRKAA